jgi:hypothetical protein
MKIFRSVMLALSVFGMFLFVNSTPAQAAGGNCSGYGGSCTQQLTVNTVSQRITVAYATGGNYYISHSNTAYFACGRSSGLYKIYVYSGKNIRLRGFIFGDDTRYDTIYFTTTGWHALPVDFRAPDCTIRESDPDRHGVIDDILMYNQ